jgi:hypothetical protein
MDGELWFDDKFDPVGMPSPLDWSFDPYQHPTWRFDFHNLGWLYPLFEATDVSGEARYEERALEILDSWAKDHEGDLEPSDFSWDLHAAAYRGRVFACAYARTRLDRLLPTISRHAVLLAADENYAGPWNHGIDQDITLLELGVVAGRDDWQETAQRRLERALETIVDDQGATTEQAVGYDAYVWLILEELAERISRFRLSPLPGLEKRNSIPRFLAHASNPEGRYAPIGDTSRKPVAAIAEPVAEYVASAGHIGTEPADTVAVYDAGYVFGRSGWGRARPIAEEDWYAIRFGPGRAVHGHRDHTSILAYGMGQELITEAGFGGYRKDRFRSYEQLEVGHNMVVSQEAGRYVWESQTSLVAREMHADWQYYDLADRPYLDVNRRRGIFVQFDPFVIVVRDNVASRSGTARRYEQLWHLSPNSEVVATGHGVVRRRRGIDLHIQVLTPFSGTSVYFGDQGPGGWQAQGVDDRSPAPVVSFSRSGVNAEFITIIAPLQSGGRFRADMRDGSVAGTVEGRRFALRFDDEMHIVRTHVQEDLTAERSNHLEQVDGGRREQRSAGENRL